MAENFMSSFMAGFKFMSSMEDAEKRRERDQYTFGRLQKADVRADNTQIADDWASQKEWLFTGKNGETLTEAQVLGDPEKLKRITELQNSPAFRGMLMEGVPKGVDDVRMDEAVVNPDGSVTPVLSQMKGGAVLSSGPATMKRTSKETDIIRKGSLREWFNKMDTHASKFSRSFVEKEVGRRKTAGYKSDLGIIATEAGRGQQPVAQPADQAPSPQPVTPDKEVREPISTTQSAQPSPTPAKGKGASSIADRLKATKYDAGGGIGEALEGVGRAIYKGVEGGAVKYFDRATDTANTGGLARSTLEDIQSDPLGASEKYLKHRLAIEKKIGPERAEQLRKDLLGLTAPQAGKAALTDRNRYQRIAKVQSGLRLAELSGKVSPKVERVIKKVIEASPTDPKKLNVQLQKDQSLVGGMRPGAKFSKQTGGPSKEYKDALIRLHMANPTAVTMEMLERGLRTGRMSKRDIQFIVNKNFIAVGDKETGQVEIVKQFADTKSATDKAKADRQSKLDRFKSMKNYADLLYPDSKKQGGQRSQYVSRMTVAEQTLGFDITDPSMIPMIQNAERMIRAQTSGWFADSPSDYPSHTPGIIAQGLNLQDLDEAKVKFIRPLQETKFYGGKPVPEKELRDLSVYAAAMQLQGISIERASAVLVSSLNSGDPRGFKNYKPADFAKAVAQYELQGR